VSEATLLAGRGLADITGEAAGCGMLGYGMADQQTEGIHTRQHARAFVFAQGEDGPRLLLVVNDLPLVFDSVHQEVLRRLARRYGDLYTDHNTMLTATHTHCGAGGYSHHLLYNSNTKGFRPKTFAALVDGICEAVERAHDDLAPTRLVLSHGELRDASVNRARLAWARNPDAERAVFPDAIDPQTTLLRLERDGALVGAVNWFPTHNTSMTNRNRLISSDNKGYAAYHWERLVHGVDYLDDPAPGFIGAFAQTNAGDMSPNLDLRPGHGPTDDQFENTRIIGRRQYEAAAGLAADAGVAVDGPLESQLIYVDLAHVEVHPEWTGDGRFHRTSGPAGGAASFAGAGADGPAFAGFKEGKNLWWDLPSRLAYRVAPGLRDAQAPKGIVLPGGSLNRVLPVVAQRVPVQLWRIGPLHLVGIPGEVTITAGLRLRRAVAGALDVPWTDVLVAGYANGYIHYVTTPEEYTEQRYEGASTLFGRWELAALIQTAVGLAQAMRDGQTIVPGLGTRDLSRRHRRARGPRLAPDTAPEGTAFGDALEGPQPRYQVGEQVRAIFAGAHPTNDLHRGGTFVEVQREEAGGWRRVQDDGDWDTRIVWRSPAPGVSRVTVSWDIGPDTAPGRYRLRYLGDAREANGALHAFSGETGPFDVLAAETNHTENV
jgi:neutral ceramidase